MASGGDTNTESVADFGFALILTSGRIIVPGSLHNGYTGRERLIRSHSSARFCFELSGNSN